MTSNQPHKTMPWGWLALLCLAVMIGFSLSEKSREDLEAERAAQEAALQDIGR